MHVETKPPYLIKFLQKIITDAQKHATVEQCIQPNLHLTSGLKYKKSSEYQALSNRSTICVANSKDIQYTGKNYNLESFNFVFSANKKIHYCSIFEKNYQALIDYQAQAIGAFDDSQPITTCQYQYQNQHVISNSMQYNQEKNNKCELLKTCNLIFVVEEKNENNLQIKAAECDQIVQLSKMQFNELLECLLCEIGNDSSILPPSGKEPPIPEGIICIHLSLLQHEIENENKNKTISLINLLKYYFKYFTYVYSEDPHQIQQEKIKSFFNKLQINGQISINSNEKISKIYNSSLKQYVCTFSNDKENWFNHFEINRNYLFCVDIDAKKIIVLRHEELLEYQCFFEALHKIYEDQLILKIFNIQDNISANIQELLYNTKNFILDTSNPNFYQKNGVTQLFLLAKNTECTFIGQVITDAGQEEEEMIQYKKMFELRMYSFFGVNAPNCCLSHQQLYSISDTKEQSKGNSLKLCFMVESIKESQPFSQSFIADYKNNNNQYYYYPSAINEGPLIGFGSALAAAYLLNDTDFFGNKLQNVCLVNKIGYFEFTKLMVSNVSLSSNNEKQDSSISEKINFIVVGSGDNKITFEDLCDYDKFEFVLQITKLAESDRFAEELWNQSINTKYGEQFKFFEKEWAFRMQRITKILLKDTQNSIKAVEKQNSLSGKHSTSKNSCKNLSSASFLNHLNEKNAFFTREAKYVAEETDLGAGSFGVVSIAHSIKDPTQKFALKRLFDNKGILRDGGEINAGKDSIECNYKEEYDRELEALMKVKRIRSPFLIGYIGAQLLKNEISGAYRLELIMELCDGDLSKYLKNLRMKKENLNLSECYDIFSQIVEGMQMLHKNGIMHRDIKPQNILYKIIQIEGDEVIVWKIGDFGLASMKPLLNDAAGTLEYMAPEIYDGKDYDKAVDIWSLGLVFHKILFGYSFYSKNNFQAGYKLSSEEFEKIDKETSDLLMRMMERDQKKRISIEKIHEILKNKNKIKTVRKIIDFDEDNERKKIKEDKFTKKREKTRNMDEIKIIMQNAFEWHELGCYNKSYKMVMDALTSTKKLGTQNDLAYALARVGDLAYNLGKYNKALQYYEESLSILIKIYGKNCIQTALISFSIGNVFVELGKYKEALAHYNNALPIVTKQYGEEHTETAPIYHNIGIVLHSLGHYDHSLSYYNYALSINVKTYGEQHVETASIYQNIGIALNSLGKYKEALNYFFYALPIYIKKYGNQHTEIASNYNKIGGTMQSLGKYEEALRHYNYALSIELKLYGKQHVRVASVYQNIGMALQSLRKYEIALTYYNVALPIIVNHYGKQHIETSACYNNIGLTLLSLGNNEEAFTYLNYALLIFVQQYGEQHVQAAITYHNIGIALDNLGKYEEALTYYNRSLPIQIKHYGEEHTEIAMIYGSIGSTMRELGKYEEALTYLKHALSIFVQQCGEKHIKTQLTYSGIGCVLSLLGKYKEAFDYCNRGLFIKQHQEQHAEIASIYTNIGATHYSSRKYADALEYYNYALSIIVKQYGEDHIQTASAYGNVGLTFRSLGQYEEALTYLNHALSRFVMHYGHEHVQTAASYGNIGLTLRSLGQYEKAITCFNHVLSIHIKLYGDQHVQVANSYENIGLIFLDLKQYSTALQYFYKALQLLSCFYETNHFRIVNLSNGIALAKQKLSQSLIFTKIYVAYKYYKLLLLIL